MKWWSFTAGAAAGIAFGMYLMICLIKIAMTTWPRTTPSSWAKADE